MEEASDGSFEDGAPTRILARTILANNELHINAHEPISQSCLPYTVSTPKLKLYLSNNNDDTTYIDLLCLKVIFYNWPLCFNKFESWKSLALHWKYKHRPDRYR